MTPKELETLRFQMQLLARDILLEWLVRRAAIAEGLHAMATELQQGAEKDLHRLHQEFLSLAFPEASAAESDLRAAEAQEAFEAALVKVRSLLLSLGSK